LRKKRPKNSVISYGGKSINQGRPGRTLLKKLHEGQPEPKKKDVGRRKSIHRHKLGAFQGENWKAGGRMCQLVHAAYRSGREYV